MLPGMTIGNKGFFTGNFDLSLRDYEDSVKQTSVPLAAKYPSLVVKGDLLIAAYLGSKDAFPSTAPWNWIPIAESSGTSTGACIRARIATGGEGGSLLPRRGVLV